MTTTSWGRSLADAGAAPPPPRAGDDASPSARAPQQTAACPVVNDRPRDLAAFQAACAAAHGAPVTEHDAVAIQPGMLAWQLGRWLPVTDVYRDHDAVELHFDAAGGTSVRHAGHAAPVYVLERP